MALELRLAGAARPYAAAGARHLVAEPLEARNLVAVLRELYLELRLRRVRALLENLHYHEGPVPDLQARELLQIALLRRRYEVVDDEVRAFVRLGVLAYLLRLARADERGWVRRAALLYHARRDGDVYVLEQKHELVERALRVVSVAERGYYRLRLLGAQVARGAPLAAQRFSCASISFASEAIASTTSAALISVLSSMTQPCAGRSGAISRVMS